MTLGQLGGFIESIDPEIKIRREPPVHMGSTIFRPDMVLEKHGATLVLEVKRLRDLDDALDDARHQVATYLMAGDWREGFVFVPPVTTLRAPLEVETAVFDLGDYQLTVHAYFPGPDANE